MELAEQLEAATIDSPESSSDLQFEDLTGTDLTSPEVLDAKYDEATIWPEGFTRCGHLTC